MQNAEFRHKFFCWICGHAVDLQSCQTDEHGMAVHEECYTLKVALVSGSKRPMVRKPAHRVTALWYLISGPGARSSAK